MSVVQAPPVKEKPSQHSSCVSSVKDPGAYLDVEHLRLSFDRLGNGLGHLHAR